MSDPDDYRTALRKAQQDVLEARLAIRDARRRLARAAFAGDYATARVELRRGEEALREAQAVVRQLLQPTKAAG